MSNKRGRPPKNSLPIPSDLIDMLAYWRAAAETPFGLAIPHSNPNKLLQRLYAARREIGGFEDWKLIECETEVWIARK